MTEQKQLQPAELKDQLADLTETMQRENIKLSPEMQKYFDETLAGIKDKMAKGKMPTRKELHEFIDKIKLWIEAEGLIKQFLDKSYDEMVDTLDNYGFTDKIPEKEIVMKAMRDLDPVMIENIKKIKRPTILMTPPGDIGSKTQKFNANKKYVSGTNQQQKNLFFQESIPSSLWRNTTVKFLVSIVDGEPEMPQLPTNISNSTAEEKYNYFLEKFNKQKMQMISTQEYLMLAMKSLREYEKGNYDNNLIIDSDVKIFLNSDHLTDFQQMPIAGWSSGDRRFNFLRKHPMVRSGDDTRARPSLKILEL